MTSALHALAPRAKSRAELSTHLQKRGVEIDIADAVLDELELQGLLNDLEFANIWSESRQRQKKLSKRVIAGELRTGCTVEGRVQSIAGARGGLGDGVGIILIYVWCGLALG